MNTGSFNNNDFMVVGDALDIAEDTIGNFYKFSFRQWKRHRYDVKTLLSLRDDEVSDHAFAILNRGSRDDEGYGANTRKLDLYLICLQDHRILKAIRRDKDLQLLPLLVYIFTHELIHVVRFCNFLQRFEISEEVREKEERIVHKTTFDILRNLVLPKLDYVLDSYKDHRICEIAIS